MTNNIFLMTKVPIHGLTKKRLSASIGNCNTKRFTLLNIENIKKSLTNKKNIDFSLYTTPTKKFRSFSYSYSKNTFPYKEDQTWEKRYGI